MKKLLLLLLLSSSTYADNITLIAKGIEGHCKMSHKCDLIGSHDIQIINDTDQSHTYTYYYRVCGDFDNCISTGNNVTVAPHSRWNNHHDSRHEVVFEWSGLHQDRVTTGVTGYDNLERTDVKDIDVAY